MSNYIEIGGSPLIIGSEKIDVKQLTQLMKNHSHHTNTEPGDWFCYFVRDNVKITTDDVRIWLGMGMLSHTWRDLEFTIRQLSKLIYPDKRIEQTFVVSDEADGFNTPANLTIYIGHRAYNIGLLPGPDTIVPDGEPIA